MTKSDLQVLKNIQYILQMETCRFTRPGCDIAESIATGNQFTEEVKEGTRIWRETWLLSPLNALIAKYEPKDKSSERS